MSAMMSSVSMAPKNTKRTAVSSAARDPAKRVSTFFVLGLLWGSAFFLAGCSPEPEAEGARGEALAPAPATRVEDVLLITVDTLRADVLGFSDPSASGMAAARTPNLDRLAAKGRVFPQAHAHNVVTLPSHANILTGLYPYQHGVRENSGFRLAPEIPTLATLLRDAGFKTAAFVAAFPLDARFGLAQGFDVYDDSYPLGSRPDEFVIAERRGDVVVENALDWWRRQEGERRFLWVHLFDPHAPYAAPEPYASRYPANPYLGEVAAVDAFLAPLLEAAEDPSVLTVFTSDHGEALGEHGERTHGLFAYEATLRVPLVVRGGRASPGRDERPARHVDIAPTVLAALGLEKPTGWPGSSLLGPPSDPSGSYFEALSTHLNRGWAPLRGQIRDRRKVIELPLPELYDLASDPREETNLIAEEKARARELLRDLDQESVWPPTAGEASAEEVAKLRSLGYLSGRAKTKASYGPEDDPKRLVALDRKLHRVIDLYSTKQLDEAVTLAREVVAERPSMSMGYSLLAQALLESRRASEALTVMEQARARGILSESLGRQLALTLAEVGRAEEAIAVLLPLTGDGADPSSLNALALAQSEAGRQAAARATLDRVFAVDPDHPKAHENLGLVYLRLGDWAAARQALERAVALNDRLPNAWNSLGVALYSLGEREAALDAWQRVVEIDPEQYDTLYNLGFKAAELRRLEQARWALRRFVDGAPPSRYGRDIEQARRLLSQIGG